MLFDFGAVAPVAAPEDRVEAGGRSHPVVLRRNARARQYVLRLRLDGTVTVTLPARGSRAEAWRVMRARAGWIARQWAKLQARTVVPREWPAGTEILLRGEPYPLVLGREDGVLVLGIGPETIRLRQPVADLRPAAEALLRRLAERELPPRVQELAAREGVSVKAVTVRGQSSRWGSCSAAGRISLNWRLIQMPEAVRDYIMLHELMHRREMNHSVRFWAQVAAVCPDYREHEQWIKVNAARLGM